MAAENGAWIGRDALIDIYISAESATEPTTNWLELGGTRGLTIDASWGSVDVTNRSSLGAFREKIADYIETSISTDGVVLKAAASNVKEVRQFILAPTTASGQPCAWIRVTFPEESGATETMSYPVLLTTFNYEAPYDAEATFSLESEGIGQPVFTDIPAAP
jgi:predicted secreted protein